MENPPEYYNQSYHNHYVHYKELAEPIEPLDPLYEEGVTYYDKAVSSVLTVIMAWNPNNPDFEIAITHAQCGVYVSNPLHYPARSSTLE